MKRALSLDIFKYRKEDYSNNGLSSKYNNILLVCDEGNIEYDENNPPENLCCIDTVMDHKYVRPVAKPTGIGWMAGGTLVYSCDSRFRRMSEYPLCLHDRQETQKEYDELNR